MNCDEYNEYFNKVEKFENLNSFMRSKCIHKPWINKNSGIMGESRYLTVNNRSVFRTHSKIYDGAFLRK